MVKKKCKRLTDKNASESSKRTQESIKKYCTKKKTIMKKNFHAKQGKTEYLRNRKMPDLTHSSSILNNKKKKNSLSNIQNDVTLYEIKPLSPTKLSISVKKFYNNNNFKQYEENLHLFDKKKFAIKKNSAVDKNSQHLLKDVKQNCLVNKKNNLYCTARKKHKHFNSHKPYDLNPQLNKGHFKNKRKSIDVYHRDSSIENEKLQLDNVQSENETQTNDYPVEDYQVTHSTDSTLSISVKRFYKNKVTAVTDDNAKVNKDMPLVSDTAFNSKADFNQSPVSTKLNNSHKISLNEKLINDTNNDKQQKVTAFFPIRRSVRKTKNIVNKEKQMALEKTIASQNEDGLKIAVFPNKGRGVIASKDFARGDYVVEYSGELINFDEARKREATYSQDISTGCYMYYFKHGLMHYCIDATAESSRLGRLVNHSRFGNIGPKVVEIAGLPRIVFIAKTDIKEGEELTYDYGDRSKSSLVNHPWLAY